MEEKRKLAKYKITAMHGFGGTDMSGEWHGNGSYYTNIRNTLVDCKHNYQVEFHKMFNRQGYDLIVFLCLDAINSNDYKLFQQRRVKTLKECKLVAMQFIREYETLDSFDKNILPELNQRYRPVYAYINNELCEVGQTIFGCISDVSGLGHIKNQYRYYHQNQPDYYNIRSKKFYYPSISGEGLSYIELDCGVMIGGGVTGNELAKILSDIENIKQPIAA